MSHCMVLFCENKGKIPGISYFSHDSWLRALGRDPNVEHLSQTNRVCSIHFSPEDIVTTNAGFRLVPNAIPKLDLGIRRPLVPVQQLEERIHQEETQSEWSTDNKENMMLGSFITPIELSPKVSSSESTSCIFEDSHLERKLTSNISSSSCDSDGLKGINKRNRRDVRCYHNYSLSPRRINKQLKEIQKKKTIVQNELRRVKVRYSRLVRKVTSLRQIVWQLRKKRFLSEDALQLLESTYSGLPLSLMRRAIANASKTNKKQSRTKIPEEIRSFAMTLQFYSSKAYNYVRRTFNLALPAPSTIRGWLSNINCEPGFSSCSLQTLQCIAEANLKNNKKTVCSLMMDEMAIKKQIEFKGNKTWGYVDLGTGINDDSMKCAVDALVLMVVSVNDSWKIPIAYYLVNSLTGADKANIVTEALRKLFNIGVTITSVTCDGPSAHFTMAEKLGADIRNIYNLKPYFKHPMEDSYVYIIFDACHMMKLVRNNWATCGRFLDKDNKIIDFQFITKLHSLQDNEFCRFGNKLRKSHIEWQKQRMKVNLAVQTISASIADSLDFLREDVLHAEFIESAATVTFIRTFDKVFDFLNSRNPFSKGYKAPLRLSNEMFFRPILEEALDYIKSLKNINGQPLHSTRNKTPFRGLSITIISILGIFDDYLKNADHPLKYVLTYKFSQDHLELFFCCIRARNGWNNNPTTYQFHTTYRRLSLHHDIKNIIGNVAMMDSTNILTTTVKSKKVLHPEIGLDDIGIIKKYNIDINDMFVEDEDYNEAVSVLPLLSELTGNVVTYISGFVVKSVKKLIRCNTCLHALENFSNSTMDESGFKLLSRKNRGGLIQPTKSVVTICLFLEKKIRQVLNITNNKVPPENNFFNTFIQHIAIVMFERNTIFPELDNHIYDQAFLEINHKMKLIRSICQVYAKIRLYNVAKIQTESVRGELLRKSLTKLILFSHQ